MGFRFYRYKGNEKVYQCTYVDVKELNEYGTECRIPIFVDAESRNDATVFPIYDREVAVFIADWLELCCEEEDEE